MLGTHLLASRSNLQSTIALSSCEAEFYALTKAAAHRLMLRAIAKDWGIDIDLQVLTDSSSAKSFAERRGLGKNRHVMTKILWVQERISGGDFVLAKVGTKNNLADTMTKPLSRTELMRHITNMSIRFKKRSSQQKTLLKTNG